MNRMQLSFVRPVQRHQQGVSLLVVLILLVVMSVLGIAVLRSSAMQERMSANMVDRNEAMQAAETGLQAAHQAVIRGTFGNMWQDVGTFTALRGGLTCAANGVCDRSNPAAPTTWETAPDKPSTWTTLANGARYGFTVEYLGVAKAESAETRAVCMTTAAPRWMCERPLFRVTSYGRGRGLAQVVLQANIVSQAP